MARSYNKLWKLMIDKKMNKTQLRTQWQGQLKCHGKVRTEMNQSQSETLEKICGVLQCDIGI